MDTFLAIDYTKSIKKERLVYKASSDLMFEYIIFYTCIVTFTTGSIVTVIGGIVDPNTSVWLSVAGGIAGSWLIANAILLNTFIKIIGTNLDDNKRDMVTAISAFKTLNNLDQTNANTLRDVRLSSFFSDGRVVTCLFDTDIVYLNITSLMRGNSLSIFGGMYSYVVCRQIATEFKEIQDNHLIKDKTTSL